MCTPPCQRLSHGTKCQRGEGGSPRQPHDGIQTNKHLSYKYIYRFPNFKVLLIWTLTQLFIHHSEMRKIKVCFTRSCFLSWWIIVGHLVFEYLATTVSVWLNFVMHEWMSEWIKVYLALDHVSPKCTRVSLFAIYYYCCLIDWLHTNPGNAFPLLHEKMNP